MSEKRGIFSLEEFYDLQVSGETTNIFDPYIYVKNAAPYGYIGGGTPNNYHSSPNISAIYKVDYSNDNPTQVSSFSSPLATQTATGNSDFAYFAGGTVAPSPLAISNVYRLDYGNDSATPLNKGPLTITRNRAAATGNLDFGYISGDGFLSYTSIDRIDYANDSTTASPKGNLINTVNHGHGGLGNLTYGYFIGGWGAPGAPYPYTVSTVQRFDYSNDSAALTTRGNLWNSNQMMASMGNADYGWYVGGIEYHSNFLSRTARIDYASDTGTSSTRGYLQTATGYQRGHGNSTHGYTAGGYQPSFGAIYTSYKIDYANDTATASPAYGVPNSYFLAATSPLGNGFPTTSPLILNGVDRSAQGTPSTFGYFAGGFLYDYNSRSSSTCRIDFSNDTSALGTKGALSTNEHSECDGTSNSNHGYIIGGSMPSTLNPSPSYRTQSIVSRIDYANDTTTATRVGNFFYRQYTVGIRATGNNDFGYFIGSNPSSNVSRIDYANDNSGTSERGNITNTSVYQGAATGNLNFGYFVKYTRVERLDYSNDTAASTRKGDLSAAGSYYGAGVGNGDFGYFASGQPESVSTIISRLDYSNDTAQGLPKGNIAERRRQFAGTGNSNFGYYGGGTNNTGSLNSYVPSASIVSSTTRIDYANDTAATAPKGNLTATSPYGGTRGLSAVSSSDDGKSAGINFPRIRFIDNQEAVSTPPALYNYAYFSGGTSYRSFMNRIDYANDTQTIPDRSNLSVGRRHHYGVGNQNYGYFAGGETAPAGNPSTSVERLDYANDNSMPSPKGPLNSTMTKGKATGNFSYGYLASDYSNNSSSGSSVIQRIDYANDTATASNKGPLTYSVWGTGASGTLDFGVFSGGQTGQNYSPSAYNNVWKMDYSNETVTNYSIMPSGRARHGSVGNPNYGWCIAGAPGFQDLERINYSNSTLTTTNRNGSTGQFFDGGSTGNNDFGYYGGGGYPANISYFPSTVRRVEYANDTNTTLLRCNFPSSQYSSLSMPTTYGKAAVSALANGFPAITTQDGIAPYSSFNFPVQLDPPPPPSGYFAGGYNYNPATSGNDSTKVERIDFTNDTATALVRGDLSHSPGNMLSVTSSLTHGYVAGGHVVPVKSTISRIDYANDTALSSPRGPLSFARGKASGLSNKNYGYHAGGMNFIGSPSYSAIAYSIVDRVDYANDTATASPKGPLSAASAYQQASGNLSYGYYVGQSPSTGGLAPAKTNVQRIDYANDTGATSQRGNMNIGRSTRAAAGNANYGYFTTGYAPSPANSDTSRIDYANDNVTASPKGNFWVAAYKSGGTGTSDYGYIAVGFTPTGSTNGFSTVGRIDYANDTVTVPQRGTMAFPKATRPQGFSAEASGLPS